MVMSTDGTRIYVTNDADATVSVVDTSTNTVVHTIPRNVLIPGGITGGTAGPLALSPDGRRLFVYALGLRVIDTASWQLIDSPVLGYPVSGLAASRDGSRLYYNVAGGPRLGPNGEIINVPERLVAVDASSFATLSDSALPGLAAAGNLSASPDGRYLYLPRARDNGASTLTVYDTASLTVAHDRPVPNAFAVAARVSPNSAYLYAVGLGNQDQLYRFSPTTHLELGTTSGVSGFDVAFNADSSRAYVPNGTQLLVIDTSTHTVSRRIALSSTTDGFARRVLARGAVPIDPTPSNFRVIDMDGTRVTFAWNQPASGPASGYAIEGGTSPGGVLASVPTGSSDTTFTIDVPPGTFFVRVRALTSSGLTPPSNEIRVVTAPLPPSAPADLKGLAAGTELALSWRNTFDGGAPTSLVLDVRGDINASLPIAQSETFRYVGVPPGSYTFSLRAVNANGSSASTAEVSLTFPGVCPGVPHTAQNLVLQRSGSRLVVRWDAPATGPAVSGYLLRATGAVNAAVPLARRFIDSPVPSGTYNISVAAVNPCGVGTETVTQSITVP